MSETAALKTVNLKLSEEIHRLLKVHAVASGKTLSSLILDLIKMGLKESHQDLVLQLIKEAPIEEEEIASETMMIIEKARKEKTSIPWEKINEELDRET